MIRVKPVPHNAFAPLRDGDGNPGWVHDCGAFTYAPTQPERCGQCWSALRTRQAHNGSWHLTYITKKEPS
jgi:hypothetical protein